MIEFKNVGLSYEGNIVLDKLSFKIKKNEKVCISGPSGKGKTSILKLIQAYVIADTGKIFIDGLLLNEKNTAQIRHLIAYIPQDVNLLSDSAHSLIKEMEITHLMPEIIKNIIFLGLKKQFLDTRFPLLSGGEKQKIIIAICLSLNKKIILLDEPASSLDDDSIDKLIELINQHTDKTIISVSHKAKWINSHNRLIEI